MAFIDAATGRAVPASIATYSDGTPRPGYREILGEGERVSFDLAFRDAAPSRTSTVFLMDSTRQAADRQAETEAYDRSVRALNDWRGAPSESSATADASSASGEADAYRESVNALNDWRSSPPQFSSYGR